MAIQRHRGNSLEDMMPQSFSHMLDRFFNESVNSRTNLPAFNPQVDTAESETGYEIEVMLPGLKKEEINLDFQDGRLTVSGERRFTDEKKNKKYHLIESQYGSFSRSFFLPDTIDAAGIEAEFEDGVLRISVPKDTRRTARQQIRIKGSSPTPEPTQVTEGTNTETPENTGKGNSKK